MNAAPMSAVDSAIANFEAVAQQTSTIRWEQIQEVRTLWNTLKNVGDNAPRMIEVKMTMMNTLNSLLKDQEGAALQNVKIQLSKKDAENNGVMAAQIVELIKQVQVLTPSAGHNSLGVPNADEANAKLNERFAEGGLDISEDELQECAGHPKNELDLESIKKDKASDEDEA